MIKFYLIQVHFCVCILPPADDILPVGVVMDPLAISPEALLVAIPVHEIPIKSVAPLAATSEKSIRAVVKVDVYTHVIIDN